MPPTRYFRSAPPEITWDLSGVSGPAFEALIARHLQSLYSYDRKNIRVRQTPGHDRGKDVLIRTRRDIDVFGVKIPAPARGWRTIHVECKLRTGDRLDTEFFFDFAQFTDDTMPEYYFLVTTTSVTPYVHHKAVTTCAKDNVEFRLIDRVMLAEYLSRHKVPAGKVPDVRLPQDLAVEYQVESSLYATDGQIDIYLVIRNFLPDTKAYRMSLATNESWSMSDAPHALTDVLEPLEARTYKLVAKRRYFDAGADRLEIAVTIDNDQSAITVTAPKVTFDFMPSLFGAHHQATVRRLYRAIDGNQGFLLFSVTGQAGVGKTRVIMDALSEFVDSNVDVAKIYFQRTDQTDDALRVFDRFKLRLPRSTATNAQLLASLFKRFPDPMRNRVLVLEDLHHASKAVLDVIKDAVLRPPAAGSPMAVILTGRNDFTFPNEHYFSLLQLLGITGESDCSVELKPLKKLETLNLIRATIKGAPDVVVDRVYALSENLPFHVMQAIEYLLEVRVAQLLNRNQVGIPHVDRFPAKRHIPDTIEQLYDLRFDALLKKRFGDVMIDFLTIQSFFGFVIQPTLIREVLDAHDTDAILATLMQYRFIEHQLDGELTFCHENLLAALRTRARRPEHRIRASRLVLARPELFRLLGDLDQGDVLFLNGAYGDALQQFRRITDAIKPIDNFSSEDLDVRFFHYIDAVFECALANGEAPDLLRKILLAKAYMGIHNYPLYLGAKACEAALAQLRRVKLPEAARVVAESEIRQLRAHGLLNMGHTRQALGQMLELEQRVRTEPLLAEQHELVFDLYDRMHELYKKYNHFEVAASYSRQAREVADASRNRKLLACHAITEVGTHLYRDAALALERATWAHELCCAHGAYRLRVYTRLSKLVASALTMPKKAALAKLLPDIRSILQEAMLKNLSDSLMRSQLFLATLTYLLAPSDASALDEAEQHIKAGINNCAKFGNGLFEWLFYNLSAVIKHARREKPRVVADLFMTAIDRLDHQALLFVGRHDFTYPNVFVISNALQFWSFSERDARDLLDRVTDYDTEPTIETWRAASNLLKKKRLFFQPPVSFACLSDPVHNYWLPIL